MSVDLTLLPDLLPPLKKFNGWFWAILLLVFIIVGSIVTLITSFYFSTSNLLFILGCLILPGCSWLVTFLYGIYYRGYREAYIKQWNIRRNQRKQELIDYARRGLFLYHANLITEFGSAENASKIVNGQVVLETKPFRGSSSPIAHSAIPMPKERHMSNGDFIERLHDIFSSWQSDLYLSVANLPVGSPIHVRIFANNINQQDLTTLWLKIFGATIKADSLLIENSGGANFVEEWLDNSDHDNECLLIISTHLFLAPTNNEAEYASLLLLVGESLKNSTVFSDKKPEIKIYRSEQCSELPKTLDNAILWGSENTKPYDGIWYSGISIEQNIEIMNHFNDIGFDHNSVFNIDLSIGNAKKDAYFLALGLAVEQAITTNNKQLIVVGEPNITASVVANVTKK